MTRYFGSVLMRGFMTRSKAAKRRARMQSRGSSQIPYAKMRPLANWTVGSQKLDNTGAVVGGVSSPTSVPSWNPGASGSLYSLASGVPFTFQLAVIQPSLSTNAPTVGRIRIDRIFGKIHFSTPSLTGVYDLAVGIYVSEFTLNTSKWDVYDPMIPSDGARDDYFFLDSLTAFLPICDGSAGAVTAASADCSMTIDVNEPIVIGGGQAINMTVSMFSLSSTTIYAAPAVRVLIGPVA